MRGGSVMLKGWRMNVTLTRIYLSKIDGATKRGRRRICGSERIEYPSYKDTCIGIWVIFVSAYMLWIIMQDITWNSTIPFHPLYPFGIIQIIILIGILLRLNFNFLLTMQSDGSILKLLFYYLYKRDSCNKMIQHMDLLYTKYVCMHIYFVYVRVCLYQEESITKKWKTQSCNYKLIPVTPLLLLEKENFHSRCQCVWNSKSRLRL